jgi:hypothetical protein
MSLLLSHANAMGEAELKTGDVLLQSIPCYVCAMIEAEENAPFSHIGLVLKEGNQVSVLQSWLKVQALPLKTSLSFRKVNTQTRVLRAVDARGEEIQFDSAVFRAVFDQDFAGKSYDAAFLWNNADTLGEKYYCSEFVAKFLNRFLPIALKTKPMHYNQYRGDWIRYFRGTPPDGLPGISPADFDNSNLFKRVGEINYSPN